MSGESKKEDADAHASLRIELQEMKRQLAAIKGRVEAFEGRGGSYRDQSMRARLACPACGHREILHAKHVLDQGDGNQRQRLALRRPKWWSSKKEGVFNVYICNSCGLVEWRTDPQSITPDDQDLQLLTGAKAGASAEGPYR